TAMTPSATITRMMDHTNADIPLRLTRPVLALALGPRFLAFAIVFNSPGLTGRQSQQGLVSPPHRGRCRLCLRRHSRCAPAFHNYFAGFVEIKGFLGHGFLIQIQIVERLYAVEISE